MNIGDPSKEDEQTASEIGLELVQRLGPFTAKVISIMMKQIAELDNAINEQKAELSYLRKKIKDLEK